MKKILVATPFFYPHMGGSEQYLEDLSIKLLQKHSDLEIDILCYNTDKAKSTEEYKGLTIHRIPCLSILPDKFSIPNPFALVNFFNTHKDYDLICASTRFFDLSWWALLYAKLISKKIVLIDHCAGTPAHSNSLINHIVKLIDTITGSLTLRFYDKIFAVSKATKSFLKRKFGIKSEVMYGGVNSAFSNINKAKNSRIQIIYAGRMIPQKGILELFNIASNMPQIDFVLAGPGELVEELKNKLPNVKVLGKLNKKELAKKFSKSDIFVYPSYHSEGIPMVLLEAGASGMAVTASNTGGINEVIEDQKTGLLMKPKDPNSLKLALERLIADKELRGKLSKNLYSYIKSNFNWDKTAKNFYKYTNTR